MSNVYTVTLAECSSHLPESSPSLDACENEFDLHSDLCSVADHDSVVDRPEFLPNISNGTVNAEILLMSDLPSQTHCGDLFKNAVVSLQSSETSGKKMSV